MSFTEMIPGLIDPLQPPLTVVKTEPLTIIKNEPPESEIGINELINSPDEKIIPDIKNLDIETFPENLLESKFSEYVETADFVKTENASFIKTEILNNEDLETDEALAVNFSNDLNCINLSSNKSEHPEEMGIAESLRTCEITLSEDVKENIKVIKAPEIPVKPHEYTSLAENKHVCNHCRCVHTRLNHLKIHITKLHRKVNTMYQCPYCPFTSKWRSSLQSHIILKHKDTKEIQWFKCQICKMKFKLGSQLAKHKLTHLSHDQIQEDKLKFCPVCGRGFGTKSKVKEHIKYVHYKESVRRVKCEECEYTSTETHLLKLHIKTCHIGSAQSYECSECDFKTKYESKLKRHKRKHEKRYCCDKCDYITYTGQCLERHKLIHLKSEEIKYLYCYHCSHKSKRRSDLIVHIAKHFRNRDVVFHCYLCDFKTLKRDSLAKHIKNHAQFKPHEISNETETQIDDQHLKHHCDKCNYKTYARQNLKVHKIIHLKPEEIQYFYCPHCPYKSKQKGNLKSHIVRHFKNGDIQHDINYCEETKYNIKLPELREIAHEPETELVDRDLKFHCDKCNYKTYVRQNLNRHKLTHLKPKEVQYFYCHHCSSKCKHKDKLKLHILKHFKREEVVFHCYACDFMTLNRESITEHLKEHSRLQIRD